MILIIEISKRKYSLIEVSLIFSLRFSADSGTFDVLATGTGSAVTVLTLSLQRSLRDSTVQQNCAQQSAVQYH